MSALILHLLAGVAAGVAAVDSKGLVHHIRAVSHDPHLDLLDALGASQPHHSLGEAARAFHRFVGTWECHCVFYSADGKKTELIGEWIFGWILDGRLMQDVLRGYPKELASPTLDDLRCGTSVRFFDEKAAQWNVCWFGSKNSFVVIVKGGAVGNRIVLEGDDSDGDLIRWSFNDIKAGSFLWRGEKSGDRGKTWRTEQEMFLTRRTGLAKASR